MISPRKPYSCLLAILGIFFAICLLRILARSMFGITSSEKNPSYKPTPVQNLNEKPNPVVEPIDGLNRMDPNLINQVNKRDPTVKIDENELREIIEGTKNGLLLEKLVPKTNVIQTEIEMSEKEKFDKKREEINFIKKILQDIINEYSIKSMLDAPCGSFNWMPDVLHNIGHEFRYHGVDLDSTKISSFKKNYANETKWKFSVRDISQDKLPDGYDLVFSRYGLEYLTYEEIFHALKAFSKLKKSRFLLIGSYLGKHEASLTGKPFELNGFIRKINGTSEKRSLILYDIPNYLRKFNFETLKYRLIQADDALNAAN